MKKKQARKIKEIASRMGDIETQIWTDEPIQGWELLLSGYGKQPEANRIIPEATYYLPVPTFIQHSTEKELKRNFIHNGDPGVYSVVKREYDKRFLEKK
jgi:hypothetical protein